MTQSLQKKDLVKDLPLNQAIVVFMRHLMQWFVKSLPLVTLLVSEDGIVLLIHIGIGTVKLKGTGFVSYVVEVEYVKKGDKLIEFWDPAIKKDGLDDTVIVTVINSHVFNDFVMKDPAGINV